MGERIERLLEVMARLRDPESGCPWDREQSFATIAPYTVEEAFEVADAIARDDMTELVDELGDLLFQVVFHAQMARERGAFGFDDVVAAIVDKMVRRHPHVFGDARVESAAAQSVAWEALKAEERRARGAGADASRLDGVPHGVPALARALAVQRRAAGAGFDWSAPPEVLPKLGEELDELARCIAEGAGPERVRDEVGDLLFSVVNLARHLGVDAEQALRGASAKFERRFRRVEAEASAEGRRLEEEGAAALDARWRRAKAAERD